MIYIYLSLRYINREDLEFSTIENVKSVQDWDLQEDPKGVYEYPTRWRFSLRKKIFRIYFNFYRIAKFTNVSSLNLFIPENYGADKTKIYYIGLKGDFENVKKKNTF